MNPTEAETGAAPEASATPELDRSAWICNGLLATFILLSLADSITTTYGISLGAVEKFNLSKNLIAQSGVEMAMVQRFLLQSSTAVLGVIGIKKTLKSLGPRVVDIPLALITSVYAFQVIQNIGVVSHLSQLR